MIKSKEDYKFYVKEDLRSHGLEKMPFIKRLYPNSLNFTLEMRKLEYMKNTRNDFWGRLFFAFRYFRWKRLGIKLGFSIDINTFGYGASIQHHGCIIISNEVKIGNNCRVHNCVNIGKSKSSGAPVIGNNVYIGPGAKIYGDISIGNNVQIGANAVVNKTFPDDVVIAGVPARIIKTLL